MTSKTAIVTGGKSGLGAEIVKALRKNDFAVSDFSLPAIDVGEEQEVRSFAMDFHGIKVDVLVNCAGINHIEWVPKLEEASWDDVMNTNAKAIWLMAKHFCEHLRGGTILNIVSNASHMPMTTSAAYNASKGAAAILTKQLHRELFKTHNITVFAISPNKLKGTKMSEYIDAKVCELRGWTPEQAAEYQKNSLPIGEETDPATLAEFIGFLLSSKQRHKYLGGCDIPYGA